MLSRLLGLAAHRWPLLVVPLVLFTGFSIGYAYFWATPTYKATVVLAPVRQSEMGGSLGALLGQFGDLASIAGLGGLAASDDDNALAILRSRAFSEGIIKEAVLVPKLYPARWDARTQTWVAKNGAKPPTLDDAWLRFDRDVRTISRDQKTGIVTLAIRLPDREEAARVAGLMATRINDEVRIRAISEAEASLKYLDSQLRETEAVELRQAIYRLIEFQIRRKVLANSRREFAFVLIDPPTIPDEDKFETPKRGLALALGLSGGLFAGLLCLFLSQVVRPYRR